jgi:indolepyruvate decarboxylase
VEQPNLVHRWHLSAGTERPARVTTRGEFDQALKTAEQVNTGAYIEVVTDKYAASPLSMQLRESIQTLYQS